MTQPDFILIPIQLLRDKGLTSRDRELYGYIYALSQLQKGCIASNRTLSELMQTSPQVVQNSLMNLEGRGYVSRHYADEARKIRIDIVPCITFSAQVSSVRYTVSPTGDTSKQNRTEKVSPTGDQRMNGRINSRELALSSSSARAMKGSNPINITARRKELNEQLKQLRTEKRL